MATSVMDSVPEDLDCDKFEQALVMKFPTYANRFRGARLFMQILRSASITSSPVVNEHVRELVLLSSDAREVKMFSGWDDTNRSSVKIVYFSCDHIRLPYHLPAVECVASFL